MSDFFEIRVHSSKFSWRDIAVFFKTGADALVQAFPSRKRPRTFHIPVSASELVVTDHRLHSKPRPERGRKFSLSNNGAHRVDGVRVTTGRVHEIPQAVAGRDISFTIAEK